MGLGGGAAGRGVRRIMLCGARGCLGAASRGGAGAAVVRASTPSGWRGDVCVWGWASDDVPQAPSFSPRLLEVSRRRLRTYGMSWGAGS